MKSFGPYTYQQAKKIEEVLVQSGAEFDKEVDETMLDEARKRHQADDLTNSGHDHNYACVFFGLGDDVILRLSADLKPYGISLDDSPPEGEEPANFDEEFGCPKCDHKSKTRGQCPKHLVPLLSDQEWFDHNREKPNDLTGWIILGAVVIGLVCYFFFVKK